MSRAEGELGGSSCFHVPDEDADADSEPEITAILMATVHKDSRKVFLSKILLLMKLVNYRAAFAVLSRRLTILQSR